MKIKYSYHFYLCILILFVYAGKISASSGGQILPEQAAYDVEYYDLNLSIDPETKTINGTLLCRANIVDDLNVFVLHLDDRLNVDSVFIVEDDILTKCSFDRPSGKINILLESPLINGDMVSVLVYYQGKPKVAAHPPWDAGLVWKQTPSGKDWIGVACEDEGADIWWPCKDHPSDEPDSMALSFTVPSPLFVASNGQFLGTTDNGNGTLTHSWFNSSPINNYNVTFYAAEFMLIEDEYESVSGETIPFKFWVLPESYEKATNYMDVFKEEFDILEHFCGPFPFASDKHGWAHAPYWGMEHQSIIAYGHNFTTNQYGFDYIHYHELAHEWWGNLISAKDWSDVWIHEGIATYTEALFVEYKEGIKKYHEFLAYKRPYDSHRHPLAPRDEVTAGFAFDNLNPYSRGALVMHSLRYYLGDEKFFNLLKRWAYPDPNDLDNTNGRQCRIMSTDDMRDEAEGITGVELDSFFEVFFRQASYPKLDVVRYEDETTFEWITENDVILDVDVQVAVGSDTIVVDMEGGSGFLNVGMTDNVVVDPEKWILMGTPTITSVKNESVDYNFTLSQNYPNPFNPVTKIKYSIPNNGFVKLSVYDNLGREVAKLVNEEQKSGEYEIEFNAESLSSGIYFYKIEAGKFVETKKMILLK